MEFTPIVRNPGLMDPRIFRDQPMELEETLLGIGIAERVSYDAERNILFLNLEGLHVRNRDDVDRVRRVVEERCQTIGKKVALVVNYDNFLIDAAVSDTYAAMVRYMETHYYTTRLALHDQRLSPPQARRGAGAPPGGAAHLRDGRRGSFLRRRDTPQERAGPCRLIHKCKRCWRRSARRAVRNIGR